MVDARRVSILSSFFYFFRSKFQILFIFTNSQKVFCIYSPNIGATLVIMRRFSEKSSKKLKKIAQFSNKIFVHFSQKYTASALHRVKVLNFTALKHRIPAREPLYMGSISSCLVPYMAPAAGCLALYAASAQLFDSIIWWVPVVVCHLIFEKIYGIILKKPYFFPLGFH